MNNHKLKKVDILLVTLTLVLVTIALFGVFLNYQNGKLMVVIITIIALLILGVSTYRYWIAYPELRGLKAPLFVPKAIGLGWSINPRNPVGMVIVIGIAGLLVGLMLKVLID